MSKAVGMRGTREIGKIDRRYPCLIPDTAGSKGEERSVRDPIEEKDAANWLTKIYHDFRDPRGYPARLGKTTVPRAKPF